MISSSPRLPNPLAGHARATPSRLALYVVAGQGAAHFTYAELASATASRASTLAASGVGEDALVTFSGPPSLDWLLALQACWWLGAVPVLIDPGWPPSRRDRALAEVGPVMTRDPHALASATSFAPSAPWAWERPLAILFTSGSTGAPRAVPLPTYRAFFGAMGSAVRLGLHLDDAWLCCLPPWHVGGLSILVRTCLYGTAVVWQHPFNAALAHESIEGLPVTQLSLVPTMLHALLAERQGRTFPARLRWALVGGAAAPEPLVAQAEALGLTVLPTWGLTESGAQLATRSPTEPRRAGAAGPALPFAEIWAEGDCLWAGGPQLGESLPTDDLGTVDGDGWVYPSGRASRLFKSGGKWASPDAAERALAQHPDVAWVCAFPLASEKWGQVMAAWVEILPSTLAGPLPVLLPELVSSMVEAIRAQTDPAHCPRGWIFGARPSSSGLKTTDADRREWAGEIAQILQAQAPHLQPGDALLAQPHGAFSRWNPPKGS